MPDGWQPIETAPKDRKILLWDGRDLEKGWWDNVGWVMTDGQAGGWCNVDPTHWLYIPDVPHA